MDIHDTRAGQMERQRDEADRQYERGEWAKPGKQEWREAEDVIADHQRIDATELLCESIAKAYTDELRSDIGLRQVKAKAIIDAILVGDDAEAGRILRAMVYAQAEAWK